MVKPNFKFLADTSADLGSIFTESNTITSFITEAHVLKTSSKGNLGRDFRSKRRVITLQGAMDGYGYNGTTTEQRINDFIYRIEEQVNVGLSTPFLMNDSFDNDYLVYCIDFSWRRSLSDPLRIIYSFTLIEIGLIQELGNE